MENGTQEQIGRATIVSVEGAEHGQSQKQAMNHQQQGVGKAETRTEHNASRILR